MALNVDDFQKLKYTLFLEFYSLSVYIYIFFFEYISFKEIMDLKTIHCPR